MHHNKPPIHTWLRWMTICTLTQLLPTPNLHSASSSTDDTYSTKTTPSHYTQTKRRRPRSYKERKQKAAERNRDMNVQAIAFTALLFLFLYTYNKYHPTTKTIVQPPIQPLLQTQNIHYQQHNGNNHQQQNGNNNQQQSGGHQQQNNQSSTQQRNRRRNKRRRQHNPPPTQTIAQALDTLLPKVNKAIQSYKTAEYNTWIHTYDPSLNTHVKNMFTNTKVDPTVQDTLYKVQTELLKKKHLYSSITLAYCLAQCIHAYLSNNDLELLALEISGSPKQNMLGQALLQHESNTSPIDQPPTRGNANLRPLIYLLAFFNDNLDVDDKPSSARLCTLDKEAYDGHDNIHSLAKANKLYITNDECHRNEKKPHIFSNKVDITPLS